jgi:membrane protein implicated in regulation of membrane protease activity
MQLGKGMKNVFFIAQFLVFSNNGLQNAFFWLAIGGAFLLIFSALLGGDHEIQIDGHGDIDHPDMDVGHGWHFRVLNLKVMAAFVTGFGACGAIASLSGASPFFTWASAIGGGLIMAIIANVIINFFYGQQSSSSYSDEDLLGKEGVVTLEIMKDKIGEVQIKLGSLNVNRSARSEDSSQIELGANIKVVNVARPLIVKKIVD